MTELDGISLEHRDIDLGEVTLHTVLAGQGPLVVLLHGFPEFWYSWRYQIPALVRAGYRVAVPDMRGYNTSSKPKGVAAYRPQKLMDDVDKLITALGEEQAHLVGHDWGANVAWMFAMSFPHRLHRLVICNVPHPITFAKHLYTIEQGLKRSWYVFFFQLPWFPERSVSARDFHSIRTMLKWDPVNKSAFTQEDIELYVDAARQPGALTAAINYYRAIFRVSKEDRKAMIQPIHLPVLMLWGLNDRYLGPELVDPPPKLVTNVQIVRIPDASHWVQCDAAKIVNEELLRFLATS
ncbi:alpha/beta hydrolase [bacterium]|nr:alpha/beta hydrolase [bacterium]